VIVKFSGHSNESSFLKYQKLDAEVVAKKYKAFFRLINERSFVN